LVITPEFDLIIRRALTGAARQMKRRLYFQKLRLHFKKVLFQSRLARLHARYRLVCLFAKLSRNRHVKVLRL
jgi:hypothetical protein